MRSRLVTGFVLVAVTAGCTSKPEAPAPRLVQVPNVVGLDESAAVAILDSAGLCLREVRAVERGVGSVVQLPPKPNTVAEQSLRAGTRVAFHGGISLVVNRSGGEGFSGCPDNVAVLGSTVGQSRDEQP